MLPDYTQPNSPIARVLSGRYTLIVRYDREGGVVENVFTGHQTPVLANEVRDTLMYGCVRAIEQGQGGVRYATERGRRNWEALRSRWKDAI